MHHVKLILLFSLCIWLNAKAQTPYDSFAPETSRPILTSEALSREKCAQDFSLDTTLLVAMIDTQQERILLVDMSDRSIVAYAPLTDNKCHWLSPDPLLDKYPEISPYAYCANNPMNYVDPDGREWYEAEDGSIAWTDYKSQQAMDEAKLIGKYLGEAVLVFYGYRDERFGTIQGEGKYLGGDNAKLANVTLFGPQGADDVTTGLHGFTMTSDYKKYGAIDDGIWPANYDSRGKSGKIKSHWTLNCRGLIPTYDYQPNMSPYAGNLKGTMYKNGIFIHSTLYPNNRVGATTSTGCLLLDWNSMQTFNTKMFGVQHFSVQVIRH